MGSIKKALKPVTRVVDNIIPNEIKPALPYLAASFGAPYLAGSSLFQTGGILSALGTKALGKGVSASLINAATNAALGRKFNPISSATSGIMAGGGQFLSGLDSELAKSAGKFLSPGAVGDMTLGEAAVASSGSLTAGSMQAAFEEAEKANREYDDYVRQQEEAGAADIQSRRDYITRYMGMAGFDQDQIDDALSRYGYKTGGRVGFSNGGSGTLGDSMQSMKILLMKNEIISAGGGGFGGKDLDDKTDDEIIEIYEGLFGQGNANGGRIGYKFGGSTITDFLAKLGIGRPTEEIMQRMFEERKKEIFNEMFDAEAGTGAYTMQQMQEADEMATKQAMKELEEYKMRIGMELKNPPEGSVGDDVIDQIMEPRKEGRVKEDGENQTPGQEVLKQLKDFDVLPPMDDMGYMDETMQRLLKSRSGKAKGGRIGLAFGGMNDPKIPSDNIIDSMIQESTEEEKGIMTTRDDRIGLLLDLLDAQKALGDDADLDKIREYEAELFDLMGSRKTAAEGGIMGLKVGGMPSEMDLRPGGFVPIGVKEKADDVPARLSRNEFVMTADAVRAAGGGSVNKGAKRMYDLMHKLEARV